MTPRARLLAGCCLLALAALLAAAPLLHAAGKKAVPKAPPDLKTSIKLLASDDVDEIMEAVDALGNSSEAVALPILQGMQDDTLRLTKEGRVFGR